jgi:2-polyprenyl-3-methyl-5-hydroxy-6-metoxy-1,4-benzoquinol methylase
MAKAKNTHISYYENHNLVDDVDTIKGKQAEEFIKLISKSGISIKKNTKVLDVGCGVGIIGAQFAKHINASEIHGIDLSQTAILLAKKNGMKAKLVDIDDTWGYKSETFDIVIGIQIIEHVMNPDNFIKESLRVLKKNGIMILTTPNLAAWFNRLIFLFGYQPFFTEVSTVDKTVGLSFTRNLTPNRETVGHIHVFTSKALVELSEMYGFETQVLKGNSVDYLPQFMKPFDSLLSNIPSLASDTLLIAKK